MFKIIPDPTFSAPVRLTVPGQATKAAIEITFKHKGRRELSAWQERAKDAGDSDAAWLDEIVADWRGPIDAAGRPAPYTRETLATMLDAYPSSGMEIYQAYVAEYAGTNRSVQAQKP